MPHKRRRAEAVNRVLAAILSKIEQILKIWGRVSGIVRPVSRLGTSRVEEGLPPGHAGTVSDARLRRQGVHAAARIGALAGAGEILASAETLRQAGIRYGLADPRDVELLPKPDVRFDGWRIAYHYQPAGAVSGDFCDLIPGPGGDLYFVVGDVAGFAAATFMRGPAAPSNVRRSRPPNLPAREGKKPLPRSAAGTAHFRWRSTP